MRDRRLTHFARENRKEMTEPETRLWLQLRANRFLGIKFRRQKVIGRYIADFAANEPKLVVELDGDSHAVQETYDLVRTRFLESEGYRVIRITNADLMTNIDGVLTKLSRVVAEMRAGSPPPTPSPEGEGASS